MKDALPLSPEEFLLFQKLLIEESGLYFDKDRNDTLRLALWDRLRKRKYDTYQEYYNLLKFHPEGRLEIRGLLDAVTIGETYFFRNKPHFEALMSFVLPSIIEQKTATANKTIRVWSAGSSKGDEAYSLAMAMMEVFPSYEDWDISILGTDINRDALTSAKEAIYNKKDIGHLSPDYLEKYFEKRGTNYILNDRVRKLARFEYHNLAKDPFTLEGMQDLDIIFCRNVIIYFDAQTIKRVIENFYDCLRPDGYLFIGHSETLWQVTNKFETVEFPQTFFYKKALFEVEEETPKPFMGVPEISLEDIGPFGESVFEKDVFSEPKETSLEPVSETVEVERAPAPPGEVDSLYQDAIKLFHKKDYEQAISFFDKIIAKDENHINARFAKATILANQAKYDDAINALAKIIESDSLHVETYYLLGILLYKTGDYQKAKEQFRKVIYIDPEIVIAYFSLGNMYLYEKQYLKASWEFHNAVKLLEKRQKDEAVKFCEDFTVDLLLRACKKNLEEITKRN